MRMGLGELHIFQCLITILQIRIGSGQQCIDGGVIWGVLGSDFEFINRVMVLPFRKIGVRKPKVERPIIGSELQGCLVLTGRFVEHVLPSVGSRTNDVNIP